MKKTLILLAVLILFSCGKKLPPPSPDIFAPGLIRADFFINSEIRFIFNENISGSIDSGFLYTEDTVLPIERYYGDGTALAVQYQMEADYNKADLYGVADRNGNKRNFIHVKINGSLIKDTMAPSVSNAVFADSVIRIVFSEYIDSVHAVLLPSYVKNKRMYAEGNRFNIVFTDSVSIYPRRVILYYVSDIAGNILNNSIISQTYDDSMFAHSITDSLPVYEGEIRLYNNDTLHIHSAFADSSGIIRFDGLSQGIYFIMTDSLQKRIIQ